MSVTPTMVNNEEQSRNPSYLVAQSRTAVPVLGKITGQNISYEILKDKIIIGRNSAQGRVDLHINLSSYISRKHVLISYECNQFFLVCLGKNGIFIDGTFQKHNAPPCALKERCIIRFPSTTIRLTFDPATPPVLLPPPSSASPAILPPPRQNNEEEDEGLDSLQIDLQQTPMRRPMQMPIFSNVPRRYISAPPSPTGTISAVSSCPGSPRSNRHRGHNDVSRDLAQAASAIAQQFENPVALSTVKPAFSYAQLIVQAICSAPNQQLTLSEIYAHITKNYPFYRSTDKGWQNSIRHNLSLNRYFLKVPRSQEESGKGSFWRIDPDSEKKLTDTAWKKRRTTARTSNNNQNAAFSVRSLPVSPDRSHKTSPVDVSGSVPSTSGATSQSSSAIRASSIMMEYKTTVDTFQRSNRYAQSAPGSPNTGNPRGAAFSVPEPKIFHHQQPHNHIQAAPAAAYRQLQQPHTVVYQVPPTTQQQQSSSVSNETNHQAHVTQPKVYETHYATAPQSSVPSHTPQSSVPSHTPLQISSLASGVTVTVANQIKVPFNPQAHARQPLPAVSFRSAERFQSGMPVIIQPMSTIPAQTVQQLVANSTAAGQGDKPTAVFVATAGQGIKPTAVFVSAAMKRPAPRSYEEPRSKIQAVTNNGDGSQQVPSSTAS